MAEFGTRPILPQNARSFTFATSHAEPREKQKNYVFVDEHNRHRRLKVMRACGSCRRRKIKCDAATTNTWPCAACVKQQLHCVPPSSDQEGDGDWLGPPKSAGLPPTRTEQLNHFDAGPYQQSYNPARRASYSSYSMASSQPLHTPMATSSNTQWNPYGTGPYPFAVADVDQYGHQLQNYQSQSSNTSLQPPPKSPSANSVGTWSSDKPEDLADVLQDLKIDSDGIAPYIANQQNILAQGPALEEKEVPLPDQAGPGRTVGIPPEMMPSDQQAMAYFDYFFANVHPYLPVINRSILYTQWQRDKYSISPLVLEGIFACSSQLMNQRDEGARWLALASRHEESFKEASRLSTIQGLILVLKAREAVPKRGYYYRSWMLIQYLITMAKDLDLQRHTECEHSGKSCGLSASDCHIHIRVWHALFCLEMIIGGPQGRFEFSIDVNSINVDVPQSVPGIDEQELRVVQDQTQMVRSVKNLRLTSQQYAAGKKRNQDFAQDAEFVRHNADYDAWFEQLPQHLQITYPSDSSPPWIPFHVAANLHCYNLLSSMMHRRPQLDFSSKMHHSEASRQLVIAYTEATKICRLHEAVLRAFGLNGMLFMTRGVNLTIYAVLTCTMLHLVAITSPDPDLNRDARDYFARHMRILERCSAAWPMPAMQVQIDSLRQAFSADLNKPFELRANFPFGSPGPSDTSSTPSDNGMAIKNEGGNKASYGRGPWASYDAAPLTPPGTGCSVSGMGDFTAMSSLADADPNMLAASSLPGRTQTIETHPQWDPSGVFDSWQTAFSSSALETPSPGIPGMQSGSVPMVSSYYTSTSPPHSGYAAYADSSIPVTSSFPQPQYPPTPTYFPQSQTQAQPQQPQQQQQPPPTDYPSAPVQPYITPSMWQNAVAKSYGDGLKRRYDDGSGMGSSYKRMR